MNLRDLIARMTGRKPLAAAAVRAVVDDSPGWQNSPDTRHDHDLDTRHALYSDSLKAWRSNPIAWRIIAITTDFVVGSRIQLTSTHAGLQRFLDSFWNHPQNRMAERLEPLCDELSRAGDLFVVLFRNPQDGMSYLRVVTKDRIARIETAPNDWERELAYFERVDALEERRWLSPNHPEASQAEAVMLHYAINRPAGALLGESDLTSLLPWLQRYAQMLEDRVRLHWATRSFLWMVTVPAQNVPEKLEQYRHAPETGQVIVKDPAEQWEVVAPDLGGQDARWDLQAIRQLIDAGSGYPPHWRGEPGDANLATAQAMQGPTERHLQRRQQFFMAMLKDVILQAYHRAAEIGMARPLRKPGPELLAAQAAEISKEDNESLARAAQAMAGALQVVGAQLGEHSPAFDRLSLELVSHFAGKPLSPAQIAAILAEKGSDA